MNTKIFNATALVLVLALCGLSAKANDIGKAFQATYDENSTIAGHSTRTYLCDGKGHGRSESISHNGRKSIGIIDTSNKTITVLMDNSKMAMQIPLSDEDLANFGLLGNDLKNKAKFIGEKTIDGHPCTGWHYDLGGGMSQEIWNGNDIGCRVFSSVKGRQFGETTSHLKSYLPIAPNPNLFMVPAEYKQIMSQTF